MYLIKLAVLVSTFHCTEGLLVLEHYPKANHLVTKLGIGKSILSCSVESDRPFKLEWYKDGKAINLTKQPPWSYPFSDASGLSLVQWPYLNNLSRGVYECRASNGVDLTVSHKVKFTPIIEKHLPLGFPVIAKRLPPLQRYPKNHYGTNITLHCNAAGKGALDIGWFIDYEPFHKRRDVWKKGEGFDYWFSQDNTTLKIYNLKKMKSSFISCFLSNEIGIQEAGRFHLYSIPPEQTNNSTQS